MPLKEFLRDLSFRSSSRSEKIAIANWLEKEVTHGTIDVSDKEVPSFLYRPTNTELALPLHAASSRLPSWHPFSCY